MQTRFNMFVLLHSSSLSVVYYWCFSEFLKTVLRSIVLWDLEVLIPYDFIAEEQRGFSFVFGPGALFAGEGWKYLIVLHLGHLIMFEGSKVSELAMESALHVNSPQWIYC